MLKNLWSSAPSRNWDTAFKPNENSRSIVAVLPCIVESIPPAQGKEAHHTEDNDRRNHKDQDAVPEGRNSPAAGGRSRVVAQCATLSPDWAGRQRPDGNGQEACHSAGQSAPEAACPSCRVELLNCTSFLESPVSIRFQHCWPPSRSHLGLMW